MKRREFMKVAASVGVTGAVIPRLAKAVPPCPPPAMGVEGGQSASTSCVAPPAGAAPAWFIEMQEGTWTAVAGGSGQRISDVLPSPVPYTGLSGENPTSITKAWTGGSVDQTRGEYILCANGGHADYPGNEAYGLSLRDATPAWRRLSDPTPNGQMPQPPSSEGNGLYNDGRPRAMHNTFQCFGDGRVWMPSMNSVTSPGGGFVNRVISYNRDGLGAASSPLAWTGSNLGPWSDYGALSGVNPNLALFGTAVFDRIAHRAYGLGGNSANSTHWWYINTQGASIGKGQVYTSGQSYGNFGGWAVCAHDLRIIVAGDMLRQTVCVLSLNSNTWSQVSNITGSGYYGSNPTGGAGGVYVQANHTIGVADPMHGTGNAIHRLQIPVSGGTYNPSGQWTWTTLRPSGLAPSGSGAGTYTKWNIVEDMGNGQSAIVVCTEIDNPTYVYKLPKNGL